MELEGARLTARRNPEPKGNMEARTSLISIGVPPATKGRTPWLLLARIDYRTSNRDRYLVVLWCVSPKTYALPNEDIVSLLCSRVASERNLDPQSGVGRRMPAPQDLRAP